MEAFVASLRQDPLMNVAKHLPELFNRIEKDLKYHQGELERSGADPAACAEIRLLQALDESFINWQRLNNIERFPKKPDETFDLRIHEFVKVTPTENREQHGLIARVEQHGYLLREGEREIILQKARVVRWDFDKQE